MKPCPALIACRVVFIEQRFGVACLVCTRVCSLAGAVHDAQSKLSLSFSPPSFDTGFIGKARIHTNNKLLEVMVSTITGTGSITIL